MTRLRDLVVVLPGIGGSVLERAGKPLWGDSLPRIAARLIEPGALSLGDEDGIRPIGLIKTSSILPGFAVAHGYGNLVNQIRNRFDGVRLDYGHPDRRVPDANLVLFPYDFRRSVTDAAERLAADVHDRLKILGPDRRVVVVAHSLGGLVARFWLGPLGGSATCRALITLGTPHRGSPKALNCLFNGIRLGRVWVPTASQVVADWPSMYDLLPSYRAVLDDATGKPVFPYELTADAFRTDWATTAFETHRLIENSWTGIADAGNVEVIWVLGRGHPTQDRCAWRDGRLDVTKDRAEWLEQDDWHGDGTVPAYSASPLEAGARPLTRRPTGLRHGVLQSWPELVGLLEMLEGAAPPPSRSAGQPTDRATLGIDVDEWYPAGEPIEIKALLHGAATDGAIDKAHYSVSAGDAPFAGGPTELERDGVGWVGCIDALAPGLYNLDVSATGAVGAEPLPIRETFAVVDPDTQL